MYTYGRIFRIEMYVFAQHGSIERLVCRANRNGPSWNPRLRARRATLGNPCPAPRREAPRSAGSLARSLKDVPRLRKPAAAHVRRRTNAERHQASFVRAPAERPQVRRRPAPYSPIGSANKSSTATSSASANLMSVPKSSAHLAFLDLGQLLSAYARHCAQASLRKPLRFAKRLHVSPNQTRFLPYMPNDFRSPHAKTPFLAGLTCSTHWSSV